MKKFTIDEVKILLIDFQVIQNDAIEEENNANDWINKIQNEELREEMSLFYSEKGKSEAKNSIEKILRNKYFSRIDLAIFSEETKNLLNSLLSFYIKYYPNYIKSLFIPEKAIENINDGNILEKIIDFKKENSWIIGRIWIAADKDLKTLELFDIVTNLATGGDENEFYLSTIWRNSTPFIQEERIINIINLVKEYKIDSNELESIWEGTDPTVQEKKIIDVIRLLKEWDKEVLNEILSGDIDSAVYAVWQNTDENVQERKLKEVIEEIKESPELVLALWRGTDSEVQKTQANELIEIIDEEGNTRQIPLFQRIIELAKDNQVTISDVWYYTDKDVRNEQATKTIEIIDEKGKTRQIPLLQRIIELLKDNPEDLTRIWRNIDAKLQTDYQDFEIEIIDEEGKKRQTTLFERIIELVKEKPEELTRVWENTNKEVQKTQAEKKVEIIDEGENTKHVSLIFFIINHSENVIKVYENSHIDIKEKIVLDAIRKLYNPLYISAFDSKSKTIIKWLKDLSLDVQEGKIDELIKLLIELEEWQDLDEIWENINSEVQKRKIKDVIQILEENYNGKKRIIGSIWEKTNKEAQEHNADLLGKIIDLYDDNLYSKLSIWKKTSPNVQKTNKNILISIIKQIIRKDKRDSRFYLEKFLDLWNNTEQDVQKELIFDLIESVMEDSNIDIAVEIWNKTKEQAQKEKIDDILKLVREKDFYLFGKIWEKTKISIQRDQLEKIIESEKENPKSIADIWRNTDKAVQQEKSELLERIIDYSKKAPETIVTIWINTAEEVQIENSELLYKVIKIVQFDRFNVLQVWRYTNSKLKSKKIEEIINLFDDPDVLLAIWYNTDKDLRRENKNLLIKIIVCISSREAYSDEIEHILKTTDKEILNQIIIEIIKELANNNSKSIGTVWKYLDKDLQQEKLEEIIEIVKNNPEILATIWANTDKNVQNNNLYLLNKLIGYAKENVQIALIIWEKTNPELQNDKLEEIIEILKESPDCLEKIWTNTDINVQKEKAYLLDKIIDYAQNDPKSLAIIWSNTDKNVQKEKAYLLETIIIDYLKDNPPMVARIWGNTHIDVQDEKVEDIIKKIKDNPNFLGVLWRNTDTVVQQKRIKRIFELIKEETNKQEASVRIKIIIENSAPSIMKDIWNLLSIEEQKEYFETIIDKITEDSKACQDLPEILETIDKNIDTERLSQILTMKDNGYLNKYIVKEILKKNIGNKSINIQKLNEEIEKIFKIFFTNNLPEVFKLFEFFKFHPNHERGKNYILYKGKTQEEIDKIILSDLIESSLDSNNNQFRNFLELLYNGNLAYTKLKNGYELDELDKSFLSSYSDTLISLYNLLKSDKIKNENDYLQNIEEIYSKLKLDKTKDIGNELLIQFFTQLGFDFSKYGSNKDKIIEELLSYTEEKRKEAIDRNRKNTDVNNLLEERRFNKRNIN